LTVCVRCKPYCAVLVDEIEKASRKFVTLFLQVFDDGHLTDGQGRVVDFRNAVIVMTSNLGVAYLNDMGEGPCDPNEANEAACDGCHTHFPPEFTNRIDEIIIFVSDISHDTIKTSMLTTSLACTFLKTIKTLVLAAHQGFSVAVVSVNPQTLWIDSPLLPRKLTLSAHESRLYLNTDDKEVRMDIAGHIIASRLGQFREFGEIPEHNDVFRETYIWLGELNGNGSKRCVIAHRGTIPEIGPHRYEGHPTATT